jgi:hypothetical protein
MKKSLFTKRLDPAKARPKKPMAPIEPVNAPLYPSVEDLYPHLEQPFPPAPRPVRSMPPVKKWP